MNRKHTHNAIGSPDGGETCATCGENFRDEVHSNVVPVRTCSDERPCIPCFTDKGECIGPVPNTRKEGGE